MEEIKAAAVVQTEQARATDWLRSASIAVKAAAIVTSSTSVLRVNQIDAHQLDSELTSMLSLQLRRIFRFFSPELLTRYRPELDAFLHIILYRHSIHIDMPSPGGFLQNVMYRTRVPPLSSCILSSPTKSIWSSSPSSSSWSLSNTAAIAAAAAPQHATSASVSSSSASSSLLSSMTNMSDTMSSSSNAISSLSPNGITSIINSNSDKLSNEGRAIGTFYPLSARQKLSYVICVIGGRWAWTRTMMYISDDAWIAYPLRSWRRRVAIMCQRLENLYRMASIANFLVFLRDARYRSITERLLRIQLVYMRPHMGRQVNFEFLNQQLVWHAFSEFLLFLLPLIDFDAIRSLIRRALRAVLGPDNNAINDTPGCGICQSHPANSAHISSCGHIYCYYCLRSARMSASPQLYQCVRCHASITSQSPLTIVSSPHVRAAVAAVAAAATTGAGPSLSSSAAATSTVAER